MTSLLMSVTRLCLGPIALYLIITQQTEMLTLALGIMIVSLFLGLINILSISGKDDKLLQIIHTVSDSIFHISIFIAFLMNQWITLWVVLVIYSRDIITPYIQSFAVQNGILVSDQLISAKAKSLIHGLSQIGITAVILGQMPKEFAGYDTITILVISAVALSILSFIHYLSAILGKQSQGSSPLNQTS